VSESHKKGQEFELEVNQLIQDIIVSVGAQDRAKIVYHPLIMGKSTKWYPDLVLNVHSLFEPFESKSLELAIIECKYIDEASSEGTYWSQMSRAYMSLNDLRLVNETSSFFLAVNKGSNRNYTDIFGNIGIKLVNVNMPDELSEFKSSLRHLIEKNSLDIQLQSFKQLLKEHSK
jgi:hypothetical protein